ncbi:MAG: hypothetical protein JW885_07035 [Deltaproteobacteria bacterium]|nr:hypothetical protein [Candidatus Zymogenaceae bacterium]
MKTIFIKAAVLVSLFILVAGPTVFSADMNTLTIEVCHGGFIPLDHANGMVFAVRVVSDTSLTIENLTIDTRWWDSIYTLHYPYVDTKVIATDEIECQDTPDVISITGAEGTIDGVRYDLTGNIFVVSPDGMGISPVDYPVKSLAVTAE